MFIFSFYIYLYFLYLFRIDKKKKNNRDTHIILTTKKKADLYIIDSVICSVVYADDI